MSDQGTIQFESDSQQLQSDIKLLHVVSDQGTIQFESDSQQETANSIARGGCV